MGCIPPKNRKLETPKGKTNNNIFSKDIKIIKVKFSNSEKQTQNLHNTPVSPVYSRPKINPNSSYPITNDGKDVEYNEINNFDLDLIKNEFELKNKNQIRKIQTMSLEKSNKFNFENFQINKNFLIPENIHDPYESYIIIKCLGEGPSGKVFKVKHKLTGELRAMKVINKHSSLPIQTENEINILKLLDHPNIIKVYEYYNTKKKLFIVTELCTGGELFDRITEVKYFTEAVAAHIMKQLFSAIAFCHSNNIIHRDLKPENILIENSEERKKDFFNIKIIDFGSGEINKSDKVSDKIGTVFYSAPEMIDKIYNEKCDMWSCGVILYILLCGCPPFSGSSDEEILTKIKEGSFQLKGKIWGEISKEAIDLINQLIVKDINKRLSANDALNHSWFKNMFSEKNKSLLEAQKINIPKNHLKGIISNIKCFRAEKKIQQAALAFIVHNLAKREDIKELKNLFMAFDLNGDGRLTKDELVQGMTQVMTKGEACHDVERIMATIDVDKNGYIEYEEFLRASLNKEKLLSKENIKTAFDLFDEDGSGFISTEELKNILGKGTNSNLSEDVWISIIKEIDENSDGQISFDEFSDVMYKLM